MHLKSINYYYNVVAAIKTKEGPAEFERHSTDLKAGE